MPLMIAAETTMHCIDSIWNYVHLRQKPAGLILAVLTNDLYSAMQLHKVCDGSLAELVNQVQKQVPIEAKGSIENVEQWIGSRI